MGKSDNIVTILIIGAAAFMFFRFAKDPTGLKGLYTSTEKYFTETIKDAEKYITDATDAAYQTINPVAKDPCDPYRLHGYVAYLGCKAGIIGNTAEQGGASPGYYTAPAKCPYDQSLLLGDTRCKMPTSGQQTLMSGISPFTNDPWLPQGGWI